MASLSGPSQRTIKIVLWLLAITMVSWLLYLIFAYALIDAIYDGRAPGALNALIGTQSTHPVEYFYKAADRIFYGDVLFFPLGMFLFYTTLYLFFRRALRYGVGSPELARPKPEISFRGDWIIVIGFCTLFTIILFRSTLSHFSSSIIGPLEDNVRYLWNIWWAERAIGSQELSLSFSNAIFYPEGGSLYLNDYSLYNLALSILLKHLLTSAAAYNALIFHSFILAGLGAFALVKYVTRSSFSGIVGGVVFSFSAVHVSQAMHHMNIASVQFIPFFILYLIKLLREGQTRNLVLASVFFLLCTLCSWTFLAMNVIVLLIVYICIAIRRSRVLNPDVLLKFGIIAGSTAVATSVWLVPMVLTIFRTPGAGAGGHGSFVIDLVGFFVPGIYHPLGSWGVVESINSTFTGTPWESAGYLGLGSLILVAMCQPRRSQSAYLALCGFVLFAVLAMGTYVHVLGEKLPVILPMSILRRLPLFDTLRAPGRFAIYVQLSWAVLVGLALRNMMDKSSSRRGLRSKFAFLILLFALDVGVWRSESTQIELPKAYRSIMDSKGQFGILDLPDGWTENGLYMQYQSLHGIPIVQGTVPRKVGESLQDRLELDDPGKLRAQLTSNQVKFIVIHQDLKSRAWPSYTPNLSAEFSEVYRDSSAIVLAVY